MLIGLLFELMQQLVDYENDKKTKTQTFVYQFGFERSIKLFKSVWIALWIYPLVPLLINLLGSVSKAVLLAVILLIYSQLIFRRLIFILRIKPHLNNII